MRRLRFVSLAVILALCLSIAPLPSQTAVANPGDYNVPDPYSKIQTAIDAASAAGGGTVNVAAGNYPENIEMKGGVIIQGSGANVTFIDGGGSSSVVKANNIGSNAKLDGFTITNGNATISVGGAGGGISLQSGSSANISNCIIIDNSAARYGGGIWVHDSSPIISNCVIAGNSAVNYGGGIFVSTVSSTTVSSPTVTNCTLTGNSATDGGGMYNWSSNPTITNSIIYGNTATENGPNIFDFTSTPSITYSCVGGGYSGTGNIAADPLFENTGAGNYHLQVVPTLSPCIDAGNNNAPGILEFDLDGNDRKADGNGDTVLTVDMGAYEVNAPQNEPPVADAGGDATYTLAFSQPTMEVELNGSNSTDSDGTIVAYSWTGNPDPDDVVAPTVTLGAGVYDFTLVVTDDDDATSEPDTVTITVNEANFDAPAIKSEAIAKLESVKTGDKKIDKKIDKAIKNIEKSLEDRLWIDTSHLDPKDGEKVFSEEKKAVRELMKIKNNPAVSQAITLLLAVDQSLAQIAIDDADASGGDAKRIAKAQKEMTKAQEQIDEDHYDKAIEHYRKAWTHAQKAMK